mmetsp:Transcript_31237/g.57119  ORF Transcript_31237/g.57119 Transcript_31237/m.57119 type:complete len:374 (-) Transcript_31237:105-1226(-)
MVDEDKDRSQRLIGEWKHDNNVLTIAQDGDQLKLVTESGRAPLLLEKDGEEFVARMKGKDLYAINLDGEDAVEMKKGDQTYQLQRVAKTKSLQGEWSHNGKSVTMEERGDGLVMVSSGRELKLLRIELNKWEASEVDAGAVYHIEHTEGDDKAAVTRIEGGGSIDFHKVRKEERRRSPAERETDRDRRRDTSRPRDTSRGRDDDRKTKEKIEESLLEFVKNNNLSQRVEDALRSLSKTDREYIISFELKGDIRDPDAVIMSRIRKLQMGGRSSGFGGKGGGKHNDRRPAGSRSRGRGRSRRRSRSDSRGDSRDMSYTYSCSEYSDESSYSYVSVKKRKRKAAPGKGSKKDSATKVKKDKDKEKKGKKDRKRKR